MICRKKVSGNDKNVYWFVYLLSFLLINSTDTTEFVDISLELNNYRINEIIHRTESTYR